MLNILFIDTETTGLVNFDLPADHPGQPRLVQIAAILADENGRVLSQIHLVVEPDGWSVPNQMIAIHGITTDFCCLVGVPLCTVMDVLDSLAFSASTVVAHNVDFDRKMIEGECLRLGRPDEISKLASYCTMKAATPILKLPGRKDGYKWPSLREAYRLFFAEEMEDAHDALADVTACMKCYFAIRAMQTTLA